MTGEETIPYSKEFMEKYGKNLEKLGLKLPNRGARTKGNKFKKVMQSKSKENPCSVCGETKWNNFPDGRKYCLKCGGLDTDKKPLVDTPKKQKTEEITDFEFVVTLPEKKPKKQKIEEITDFELIVPQKKI
jgi:hypothetical protein